MKSSFPRLPRRAWRWLAGSAAVLAAAALVPITVNAACCYFAAVDKDINQPGQKAFITWHPEEKVESFTVQPRFEGNAADFGMVVPTPGQPKLHEMPRDFFKDLAIYTILMPLPEPIWPYLLPMPAVRSGAMRGRRALEAEADGAEGKSVRVLEAGVVGSLDYKIIVADDAKGLFSWLEDNHYAYAGDTATLDYYVQKAWFFTVMKIDPAQMKKASDGTYLGEVTPTRFTFETDECVYPLKITQISVKDTTDALLYVQAPQQMDLKGDWSWRHSFRTMYLTFRVGCGATPDETKELQARNRWVAQKRKEDPKFDTTKLEWAKELTEADLAVCDKPLANYAQMGGSDLPPGAVYITLDQFLRQAWKEYEESESSGNEKYAKQRLEEMRKQYAADKGRIVEIAKPGQQFTPTQYMWYPNREAPAADVEGLTRLKGHLRRGQWITKIRKIIRKDEMSADLELVALPEDQHQEYVRILPTSPP